MLTPKTNNTSASFACDTCGGKTTVTVQWIIDFGTPECPSCEYDMELTTDILVVDTE